MLGQVLGFAEGMLQLCRLEANVSQKLASRKQTLSAVTELMHFDNVASDSLQIVSMVIQVQSYFHVEIRTEDGFLHN